MTTRKRRLNRIRVSFISAILLVLCSASISANNTQTAPGDPSKEQATVNNPGTQPGVASPTIVNPNPPADLREDQYERTFPELIFTLMVIVLAVAAMSMQFFLLKKNPAIAPEDSLRTFGVTLIIIGTLFFITAGFDSEQIAPALGLFGTIAGYLLGRSKQGTPAMSAQQKGRVR